MSNRCRYGTCAKALLIVHALSAGLAAVPARAGDSCVDFKWDVSNERALFAGTPARVTAGKDSKTAPVVVPNRLYALSLAPQNRVAYSMPPAKRFTSAGAYGGLATLKIQSSGSFRVAVDLPFWIDVVSNGALVAAQDFQGQHDCSAPHKIVEFHLTAGQPLVLQLSNAGKDTILLTVTPAPARKL